MTRREGPQTLTLVGTVRRMRTATIAATVLTLLAGGSAVQAAPPPAAKCTWASSQARTGDVVWTTKIVSCPYLRIDDVRVYKTTPNGDTTLVVATRRPR